MTASPRGLNDPDPGGGFRGWADRVAEALSQIEPGFRYANLAVRGKLLGQIIAEQVPRAAGALPFPSRARRGARAIR